MSTELKTCQPLNLPGILLLAEDLPPEARAALVVSLLNQQEIPMFGKSIQVNREIFPEIGRRNIYDIHPYRKAGSGAHTIVFSKNEAGEALVLLGQKKERHQWIVPGGYFQPYPLEGTPGWQPYEDVGEASTSDIKYDLNLKCCAARELFEETGVRVAPENFSLLAEYSERNGNDPRLHSINMYYVTNLSRPPSITPHSDLVEAHWIPIKEIERLSLPVRTEHLNMIHAALDQQQQSALVKLSALKSPYCEYEVTENPLYGLERTAGSSSHCSRL